jgi:hypothetical protein
MKHTLDDLVAEDDLVTVRFGSTFEDGIFSTTSGAGTRGVPGGVRSLNVQHNTQSQCTNQMATCIDKKKHIINEETSN